jgi:hypothetical protein
MWVRWEVAWWGEGSNRGHHPYVHADYCSQQCGVLLNSV